MAPNLTVGYNLLAEGLEPLGLGARVRFRLDDKMAIYTPGGQLSIALEETAPIPPATEGARPITLDLPVGFQYQATPSIHAYVQTTVASLAISDSESAFIFADFLPLTLGGFFSPSNTMDLGASIGWFDLIDASDFITIVASARLHL